MTRGATIVLLGVGVGAIVVASRASARAPAPPRERPDDLRARVVEAQRISARASLLARELAERWSAAQERNGRG